VRAWLNGIKGDTTNPGHLEKALLYRVPPPILEELHIIMQGKKIKSYSDLGRNTASECLREAYDEFVRGHAHQRVCELRNDLMIRTILAYNPPTGTASHATLDELQQAAQIGQWETRGSPQWESRVPQSAPVGQGHGGHSQHWRQFDVGHNAPRVFGDPVMDQRRQFAHGGQMMDPHMHMRQTPHDANVFMHPPQHDGRPPFMHPSPHDGRPPHATGVGNMGNPYPPQEEN